MEFFQQFKIYEIIIALYGLSLIFYFYDFVQRDRKANQMAFWFLLLVWILQTIFLFVKIYIDGALPIFILVEGLYFYAWLILLVSIVINYFFQMDFVVFIMNVVGFLVMVLFLLTHTTGQSNVDSVLVSEILLTHIILAFIAYTLYTLSFAFSLLYLLQFYLLKKKKWQQLVRRIGSLGLLERISFLLITFATPLLLISLVFGILWAYTSSDLFYWIDLKTIGSFFVILVYSVILYIKVRNHFTGKNIAILNMVAFLVLFINYLILSMWSNFHGI
ncbi:cytochrome C assembly family protein [Halalkalibacillus halophilus]|uniref:cytochrome C assembly family protein n=1 Tax=Halalkalibacillus halophilus TaxID=392827 RepID=UPI0003FFB51E|nr:cytochrome c biogenesis protein CcsA [Halalkalibacillus halophilus]